MWESFQERQMGPGVPHPAQKAKKPSDQLTKCAERYLKWLTAPQLDDQARYNMMSIVTNTTIREVELIKIIRQLCPNVRVDRPNSDIGWNDHTVFLWLHLNGTHTGYLLLKRC